MSALTGVNGVFVLPPTMLGDNFITAKHSNFGCGEAVLEPKHYAGEPIDVTVPSGTSLACTVLANGIPAKGAWVGVVCDQTYASENGKTGADGKCLVGNVPPGEHTVEVHLTSDPPTGAYATERRTVDFSAGRATELVVDFPLGDASISGNLDPQISSALILLTVASAQDKQEYFYHFDARSQDEPSFSFSNLPAGEASMRVSWVLSGSHALGQSERRYAYTLTPRSAIRQDIPQVGGPALWGTVGPLPTDAGGVAVVRGRAAAQTKLADLPEKDFCGYIPIAPDGTFRMEGFEPGTYTLIARVFPKDDPRPDQARESAATVVELGEQGKEVNLRLTE
jgi:hypothetical protein